MREYIKNGRSKYVIEKKYRKINNRSNKIAIAELKDSYVKNRLFKGRKSHPVSTEVMEAQRTLLILKRALKNGSTRQNH